MAVKLIQKSTMRFTSAQNVLAIMEPHGVKGLVVVTGMGAGDSMGHGGFLYDRILTPCC